MKLSTRIALKYVFSFSRSFNFITVVSIISFVGIAVGIAALICVISIFNGFREFTESRLVKNDPHIRIEPESGARLADPEKIIEIARKTDGVINAAPLTQGRIVAQSGSEIQIVLLSGMNVGDVESLYDVDRSIILGSFFQYPSDLPQVFIGSGISRRLGAYPGDTLSLSTPAMIESSVRTMRRKPGLNAVVSGVFKTNFDEYDDFYVFADRELVAKLFDLPKGSAGAIDIRTNDFKTAEITAKIISEKLPGGYSIFTWKDLHKDLFGVMEFERMVAFILLGLIVVIAVFNELASLSMTVVEKRSDIAVLKSMGATPGMIRAVFVKAGLIVGGASSIIGTALGLGLCYGQIRWNWFSFDSGAYLIPGIPVSVHATDVIIIAAFGLILSLFAGLYPASRAAKTIIASSLRND